MDDHRVLKDLKDRESFGLERGAIRCAQCCHIQPPFLGSAVVPMRAVSASFVVSLLARILF